MNSSKIGTFSNKIHTETIPTLSDPRQLCISSLCPQLLYEQKTLVIQSWVRGWLARRRQQHYVAAVVLLQSCVRRLGAQRELKRLRAEARSVEHFKKLSVGMENKIMQLQRRIDQQVRTHTLGVCC